MVGIHDLNKTLQHITSVVLFFGGVEFTQSVFYFVYHVY